MSLEKFEATLMEAPEVLHLALLRVVMAVKAGTISKGKGKRVMRNIIRNWDQKPVVSRRSWCVWCLP